MSSTKKIDMKGTLRQVFICLCAQNPIRPYRYTLYTCIQNSCSYMEGGGGGGMNQREGERGNSSQKWVENTNVTDCIFSL
jgi:hypothetical protein